MGKIRRRDIPPLWVADMDFAAPPAVIDAITQRLAHPVLGYGQAPASVADAVIDHLERHYDWRIEAEGGSSGCLVWSPAPTCRLSRRRWCQNNHAIRPFSAPRFRAGTAAHRTRLRRPLVARPGQAGGGNNAGQRPLPALPSVITRSGAAGRRTGGHCRARTETNDLIVCADEIPLRPDSRRDKRHIPFASLSPGNCPAHHHADGAVEDLQYSRLGCALQVISGTGAFCAVASCAQWMASSRM